MLSHDILLSCGGSSVAYGRRASPPQDWSEKRRGERRNVGGLHSSCDIGGIWYVLGGNDMYHICVAGNGPQDPLCTNVAKSVGGDGAFSFCAERVSNQE